MIVVSPRSTVTRLVAPRNVEAITVPVSGPESGTVADPARSKYRQVEMGQH